MRYCEAVKEFLFGLPTLKALDELSFHGCKSLKKIPEGLGGLSYLKKVYLWGCEALEEFPSGICTFKALEELQFNGCKSLRKIPEGLGGLTYLGIFPCGVVRLWINGNVLQRSLVQICGLNAHSILVYFGLDHALNY
jgi:hypothetical protein